MRKNNIILFPLIIILSFPWIMYATGPNNIPESPEAEFYFRLSQTHSTNNKPAEALSAIEKAVLLSPENIEYLRARAQIANWNKKTDIAIDSYKRILRLLPNDKEAQLGLAKALSWSGKLDKSIEIFKHYLAQYPDDEEALIEYAKAEMWRGNYDVAMKTVNRYAELYGETKEYLEVKARILALSKKPDAALKITETFVKENPDDYDMVYSHTIALKHKNLFRKSIESLDILERLRPDTTETKNITKFVKTSFRPSVSLGFSFYNDSDNLNIIDYTLTGGYSLTPETRLKVIGEYTSLNADKGSGLENIDGSKDSDYNQILIGITHQFSPVIALDINAGIASADASYSKFVYNILAELQPSDGLKFGLQRSENFFAISPRTVSLGIEKEENRLYMQWEPDFLYTYIIDLKYVSLSDDNNFWEVLLAPRRTILRKEKYNMDIGISAWLTGFDEDLNNGYYSPELYQRYYLTDFFYWKISDDDGISIILSAGLQKDETMDSFHFGSSVDIEGTFGLFRDWMLKIRAGILNNTRQTSGSFDAFKIGAELTNRF